MWIWATWLISLRKSSSYCQTVHGYWKIIRSLNEHSWHWRRIPIRWNLLKNSQCLENHWKRSIGIQSSCRARKTLQCQLILLAYKSFGQETKKWKDLLSFEWIPLSQLQLQPHGRSELWEQLESILLKNWLLNFGTKWNLWNTQLNFVWYDLWWYGHYHKEHQHPSWNESRRLVVHFRYGSLHIWPQEQLQRNEEHLKNHQMERKTSWWCCWGTWTIKSSTSLIFIESFLFIYFYYIQILTKN